MDLAVNGQGMPKRLSLSNFYSPGVNIRYHGPSVRGVASFEVKPDGVPTLSLHNSSIIKPPYDDWGAFACIDLARIQRGGKV